MAVNTGLENLQSEVFDDLVAELGNDVSCDKEKGQLLSKVKVDTLGSSIINVNTPKTVDIAINIDNNSIIFFSL